MIKRVLFILITSVCCFIHAQEWSLKLKSTVQLRTWKLTSRADKDERSCEGANIQLIQNNKVLKEIVSDQEGNFVIDIPGNGDFYINVSYPGCNGKKFYVSTKNVASDIAGNNFKPSVTIGGFMMAKPFSGIDYIGLQEPLLAVEYKNNEFDKDQAISDKGVEIVQNIMDAEVRLIDKFCFQTKLGDEALNKKNYKLAKQYYTKALELIPNEEYPKFKLEKAEEKIKEEEEKKASLAAEAAAKAEAQKLALEKAKEEKKMKENASFYQGNKAIETQTAISVKDSNSTAVANNQKLDSEAVKKKADEESAKLAAEKAAKEKADSEAKAKIEADKLAAENSKKNLTEANTTEVNNITSTLTTQGEVNTRSVTPASNITSSASAQQINSGTDTQATTGELPVAENVKGKAKRKIKHQIGSSYHDDIIKADAYFKEKKYTEAKQAYSNALKDKPNDHYAIARISACNKHLGKK